MKRYWFGIIATVLMIFLGGCVGDTTIETTLPSLDDLEIVMQDEFDVPAGIYSYPFSIAEFESYQLAYGLTISVEVDVVQDDFSFSLENGILSFEVLADHVYVVTVQVLGEGVDISETRTVYATKTELHITFEDQIDGNTYEVVTCWKNDSVEAPSTQPTQEGYAFITWAYDLEGEHPWNAADTFSEDTTLYAIWQEILDNVLVTYDLNGAFQPEPIEVQIQEGSILLPPQFTPVWTGYAFDGWFYDVEGTEAVSFGNDTITTDVTIYAKWHYVYLENFENDLFSGPLFEDHSTMLDHMPIQIYQAQAIVLTTHIDWDLVQEIGVVYSTDATVSLLDPTDFHVVGD
ncbi:MAG: InlB B-repeat-containing protein, partial [Candidatus Izemoplasmatales bacterium]